MHLNPDHYLQIDGRRVFTPERNTTAWERLYADLAAALADSPRRVFLVIGVQGSGKSTWVKARLQSAADVICVDSTLATAARRSRLIEIARRAKSPVTGVWIRVSLETALGRNRTRPHDEIVPDEAIANVFRLFEAPSLSEGLDEIILIDNDAPAHTSRNQT
ncbi:AAA family ATPase [Burkholderia sp. 9120]|uniref:AAA family ATPase n=1 Tax=Burkholderia sp. 9120 TaxID=1500897 RepID=UPI0005567739|nr:AAA family ATPase [Burkholderia sp. 9120]